jgi:rare lipoprotein A
MPLDISWARSLRVVCASFLALTVCMSIPSVCAQATEPARCPESASTGAPAPKHVIGQASWYGAQFANRPTASGTPFDPEKLTAAHRKLPLGTKVVVTNLHNGKSVMVTINDRGPYWGNREIDLSYRAARMLGMVQRGVARVKIEPL